MPFKNCSFHATIVSKNHSKKNGIHTPPQVFQDQQNFNFLRTPTEAATFNSFLAWNMKATKIKLQSRALAKFLAWSKTCYGPFNTLKADFHFILGKGKVQYYCIIFMWYLEVGFCSFIENSERVSYEKDLEQLRKLVGSSIYVRE